MKRTLLLSLLSALAPLCSATDVGSGAPSEAIRQAFLNGYYRGNFQSLVTLPPSSDVKRLGSAGYVQEFSAASGSGTYALVLSTANVGSVVDGEAAQSVFQVWSGIYSYYTSLGVTTVGYPTMDSVSCPSVANNSCVYQYFSNSYVLFSYTIATSAGQNFSVSSTYYTYWVAAGGVSGIGPATSASATVTSSAGTTATMQSFTDGAIFTLTSGSSTGKILTVKAPVWSLYVSSGSYTGTLGFPLTNEVELADGTRRQTFEGGSIEYTPGTNPVYRYPVSSIWLSTSTTSIRLDPGATLTVSARLYAASGAELTDRSIAWATSNGKVATVSYTGSGLTMTITAVGGGNATITGTSETKTVSLSVFVTSQCCSVGEGSPTTAVLQAFQDAVSRNRLSVRLPVQDAVQRLGSGYVQQVQDSSTSATVLLAKPDSLAVAYAVRGALLARYLELGGPTGTLGYPISDASASGRQLFQAGALAGSPIRVVLDPILTKWAELGYETGSAGPPISDQASFFTFAATRGVAQAFQNTTIFVGVSGLSAGKAYAVSGLIAAKYAALGSATGRFGMPASEEYDVSGRRRQEFEGGSIDYAAGDTEASARENARTPKMTAAPSVAVAGSRVRISVGGFEPERTLRISITGQSDFDVYTQTGGYSWETQIPSSAKSSTVAVRAVDPQSSSSADASYTIRALADAILDFSKTAGDQQVGIPGGVLPLALKVALRDENGNPIIGVPVAFNASPGAQVSPASATTDASGVASTWFRMPAAEGVALATATASSKVVTFSALASSSSLKNFPAFTQAVDTPLGDGKGTIRETGALLASAAAALRYHQNRGDFSTANGLAEPALLNQYLTSFCVTGSDGAIFCDGFYTASDSQERIVNLWRLGSFAGSSISVVVLSPEDTAIRDAIANSSAVILALSMTADGVAAGSHFVVAKGVSANGWIQIYDPSPVFVRTTLNEYLLGFQTGGRLWKATLVGAMKLTVRNSLDAGFLVASSTAAIDIRSTSSNCGTAIGFPSSAANPSGTIPTSVGAFRFRYCDGALSRYQLDLTGTGTRKAVLTDLGDPGARAELSAGPGVSFGLSRPATVWKATPLAASLDADSLVNAATLTTAVAPGTLAYIVGTGLSGSAGATTATLGGQSMKVVSSSAFRTAVQVPLDIRAGQHILHVDSPYGSAEASVRILETAPAIFTSAGAVVNQDGTVNSALSPAPRGKTIVVYCTGLGAVSSQGTLSPAREPVTAVIEGIELPVSFAGLAPGMTGVYQVNVALPAATPPGLDLELRLRQQGADSNAVAVSVQ